MLHNLSKPDAFSGSNAKMPWHEAFRVIHELVHRETERHERNATWHSQQSEEADYSHSEAARFERNRANQIREAFEVMSRGY